MEIAIITDTHFGASKDDEYVQAHQIRFVKVFLDKIRERGIKTVFHLGDVWDKRTSWNIKTYNTFIDEFFKPLHDMGVKMYVIVGNHDIYYKNTNRVNSIQQIAERFDNIHLIQGIETVSVGGQEFDFFAWVNNENYDEFVDFVNRRNYDKGVIACGHFETIGFDMGAGTIAEHGLQPDVFKGYERVWTGHFHNPSKQMNVEYIGNPFYLTWSDYNTRKSFIIFDIETKEQTYIKNEDDIYFRINYSDVNHAEFDFERYKNKIVDCVVNDFSVTDKVEFRAWLEKMQQTCYSFDITVKQEVTTARDLGKSVVLDESGALSTRETLLSCIESIDVKGLDSNRLKNMIGNLYDGVVSNVDE